MRELMRFTGKGKVVGRLLLADGEVRFDGNAAASARSLFRMLGEVKPDPSREVYRFSEPHPTGGMSIVTITRDRILDCMYRINPYYRQVPDDDVVREFCTVHWAHAVEEE